MTSVTKFFKNLTPLSCEEENPQLEIEKKHVVSIFCRSLPYSYEYLALQ